MTVKFITILTILLAFSWMTTNGQNSKALTIENIDSLTDRDLLFEIFVNIAERYTGQTDKKKEIISKLTQEQQVFYALTVLEMEVNNGGFNQYYYNQGDEFADLAVDGFKAIGAKKFADLATRANKVFREQNKKITDKQDGSMQGFSESYKDNPLNDLDKEFYNLYKDEPLTKLTVDYVKKNKSKFIN